MDNIQIISLLFVQNIENALSDINDARKRRIKRMLNILCRSAVSSLSLAFPHRRMWKQIRHSEWFEKTVLQHYDDSRWKETFRINRSTFTIICDFLRPHLQKKKVVRDVFSVEVRIAVMLLRLSSSSELRNIAELFGMARSTVCVIVQQTTRVVVSCYMEELKFPEGDEVSIATDSFFGVCGLPGVLGALDGCHIPIKAPIRNKKDYFNRKQFYSVVLQAVVNHKKKFINLNFGWPGSVHDARVLANSELFVQCESGILDNYFCELPGAASTIPPYIVADPAYPLKQWLMKPFSGALNGQQATFNKRLSRCRVYVEHAFGMLKGRWRCLLKANDSQLKNLKYQVLACCILHNIAQDIQDEYLYEWDDNSTLCNDPTVYPVLYSNDSKSKRNLLMSWVQNYG